MKSWFQHLPGRTLSGAITLLLLLMLVLIDFRQALPINPYVAPAPVAWGSGQAPEGAHCTQVE